jgi:hypothetical protein
MAKTIFSGAWRIGRATAMALGVAVMLALVAGVASTAFGATGDAWRLGRANVATAITTLGGTLGVDGPMLRLVNNNADANDTVLDLQVRPEEAPMRVNSTTKVDNLNADQLDGQDSSTFMPARTYSQEEITVASPATGNNYFPACGAGDVAISGGYSNLATASSVLRNERYGPDPRFWAFGIYNSSQTPDEITVKVVCIDLE